jgi:hypothetical protein
MLTNLPLLFSGMSVGIILFQTTIIAPTVFGGLGPDRVGPILRKVFPKFFIILATLGLLNIICAVISDMHMQAYIGGATGVLAAIAYSLIPMTNKMRDEQNQKAFKRLHNISVLMTVTMLLINLASPFV